MTGYGPESMLGSPEAAQRARDEYEAAQARLAEQVLACRYCKGAKTRAIRKLDNAKAGLFPKGYEGERNAARRKYYVEAMERKVEHARCREHAMRGRLNFATSPVSETYWTS